MIAWHKADLEKRMHHVIEGGKKIAMPRYFKLKLYTDDERKKIQLAANAVRLQLERKSGKDDPSTWRQTEARKKAAFELEKRNCFKADKL